MFAKGGDDALADLPYLDGRSTMQLMKEVVRRDSY